SEVRSKESAENLARGAGIGLPGWRELKWPTACLLFSRKWRAGKVRPLPGNSPHDRLVSRGSLLVKESLRRSLPRHLLPAPIKIISSPSICLLRHGGTYL